MSQLSTLRLATDDKMATQQLKRLAKDSLSSLVPFVLRGKCGTELVADWITEAQIPSVYKILRHIIEGGKSAVSQTEFETEDFFRHFLAQTTVALSVTDSSQNKVVGFLNVSPQRFCRSAVPALSRGYTILDPSCTVKNIFPDFYRLLLAGGMASGSMGKMSVIPQGYITANTLTKYSGCFTCSTIPWGVHLQQSGWVDDVLIYVDYTRQFPHLPCATLSEQEVISRVLTSKWIPDNRTVAFEISLDLTVTPPGAASAHIRPAKTGDVEEIYSMFSSAAQVADGFGVDEFPSVDIFKERYLSGRALHVVEDEKSKSLMGAVVIGPSHLTRGNPRTAMMHICLLPSYQGQGYGEVIEKAVADFFSDHGYTGILTDMLLTDSNVYRFASKAGYVNIGSIPRSAYVTQQGWTDAAILYKSFHKPLTKTWVKDFSKTLPSQASL